MRGLGDRCVGSFFQLGELSTGRGSDVLGSHSPSTSMWLHGQCVSSGPLLRLPSFSPLNSCLTVTFSRAPLTRVRALYLRFISLQTWAKMDTPNLQDLCPISPGRVKTRWFLPFCSQRPSICGLSLGTRWVGSRKYSVN